MGPKESKMVSDLITKLENAYKVRKIISLFSKFTIMILQIPKFIARSNPWIEAEWPVKLLTQCEH